MVIIQAKSIDAAGNKTDNYVSWKYRGTSGKKQSCNFYFAGGKRFRD